MKILGLVTKDSGPGFHRVMMPLLMMDGPDCYITNQGSKTDIENADIVFYSRAVGEEFINYARSLNKKIVVDVDDWWRLDYHHISYKEHLEVGFPRLQIDHIEKADMVITTHERLAAKIRPYNSNILICPNAIPDHEYFDTERTESVLPRIFWQGSITHERDLMLLKNPFKRLTGCATVIAGYTEHDVWGKMVNAFTNGLTLPGAVLPGTTPMEYYHNYSYADICVAPLLKTEFNSMKSNLKVLEAAHAGLPIVCSKVDPYLDLPVLYAEKQSDWFKHLNMLIHDKYARYIHGHNLKNHCDKYFNYKQINKLRYDRFIELTAILPESEQGALRYASESAVLD